MPENLDRNRDRGFTLVELLVVIAIISILAGFLIPTIMSARGRADEVACQNNLREIQKMGMMYADSAGTRFYPIAKGTAPLAHESLNELIRFNDGNIKPDLFRCPTWRGDTAEAGEDGKYRLEENSCAYAWPTKKVSTSDNPNKALSCDKWLKSEDSMGGHDKGRNVVYLDSSVKFMRVEDASAEDVLPKGLTR